MKMEKHDNNSLLRNVPASIRVLEYGCQLIDRSRIAPEPSGFQYHEYSPKNSSAKYTYMSNIIRGSTYFYWINPLPNVANSQAKYVADDLIPDYPALVSRDPENSYFPENPLEIESFHDLVNLESRFPSLSAARIFEYISTTYRATKTNTGVRYCLRRIHGFELRDSETILKLESWKKLRHPNIVDMKDAFTTEAFGDNSFIFVYDYYEGSKTLSSKYLSPKNKNLIHLTEDRIWNIIIQITAALRTIHGAGLAYRSLELTKVITTDSLTVKLSFCGVNDVLNYDRRMSPLDVPQQQREDLTDLGKLVLGLTSKVLHIDNINEALDKLSSSYSSDLARMIMYLLSDKQEKNVDALLSMIRVRGA